MSRRFSLLAALYQFVRIPITGIAISTNGTTISSSGKLEKGRTLQLYSIISPSNTTDSKDVKWSSNDTSVAIVSLTGGVVTAKSNGTCKIMVSLSENSSIFAIYTLNVYTSSVPDPEPEPDITTTVTDIPVDEDITTTSSNPPTDFSATFKTGDGQTVKCEENGTIFLKQDPVSVYVEYEATPGDCTYNSAKREYTYVFIDKNGQEHKYFVQIED